MNTWKVPAIVKAVETIKSCVNISNGSSVKAGFSTTTCRGALEQVLLQAIEGLVYDSCFLKYVSSKINHLL